MEETNNLVEKKGTKTTVLLNEEAYSLIVNKQAEIYNKTKKRISIQDLVSISVKNGIDLIPILDSSASQV